MGDPLADIARVSDVVFMLMLKAKSKRQGAIAPPVPADSIQFRAGETIRSAIHQIARKWGCSLEEASRRIISNYM